MAALLQKEFKTNVDMIHGAYGEYKVLVDGKVVVDGGKRVMLGLYPSTQQTLADIRARLAQPR